MSMNILLKKVKGVANPKLPCYTAAANSQFVLTLICCKLVSDEDESVGGESDIWTEYGEEVTIDNITRASNKSL